MSCCYKVYERAAGGQGINIIVVYEKEKEKRKGRKGGRKGGREGI